MKTYVERYNDRESENDHGAVVWDLRLNIPGESRLIAPTHPKYIDPRTGHENMGIW